MGLTIKYLSAIMILLKKFY